MLLPLLGSLPRIERLGPLPGAAVEDAADGPEVDPRILERVRALLAKAESTTYPDEAETFTAGAQALMVRHRIAAAMVEARGERRRDAPSAVRVGIEAPYEQREGVAADRRRRGQPVPHRRGPGASASARPSASPATST